MTRPTFLAGLRESVLVLILASLVTLLLLGWMGYDLRYFTTVPIGDHHDSRVETYSLGQAIDNLLHRPGDLGYSLTLYGEPASFATTTAPYGAALLMLPVYLVTQNYFIVFNIYFVLAWLLTALVAYWLIRYLLGVSVIIALFGTLLITFSQARITRITQVQEISIEFCLFTIYCLHRLIDTPKGRWAVGLCLGMFFSLFTSGYVGMMTLLTAGLIVVYCSLTRKLSARFWKHLLISAAVCVILSLPFINFRLKSSAYLAGHNYGEILVLSATIDDWFAGSSVIYKGILPYFGVVNEVMLFIGFTPLVLAFLAWRWRKQPENDSTPEPSRKLSARDVVVLYGLIAVAGYLCTLGPVIRLGDKDLIIGPYSLLMQIPGFSSLRSVARFIVLPIVATGVLSAFTLHVLSKRQPRSTFAAILVAVAAIFSLESVPYNAIPLENNIFPHKSLAEAAALPPVQRRIYPSFVDTNTPLNRWLAGQSSGTPIFQYPVDDEAASVYLLDALKHRQPMLNTGNVSFFPKWYADADLQNFPTPELMVLLNEHHIQYFIVRRDFISLADNAAFNDRLASTEQFWGNIPLAQHFDNVDVYRVTPQPVSAQLRIKFDRPVDGTGWLTPSNGYTWMAAAPESTVKLPFLPWANADVLMRFRIAQASSLDILGRFEVSVNGVPVSVSPTMDESFGILYQGVIPRAVLDKQPGIVNISFSTGQAGSSSTQSVTTNSPPGGLLFDWLELDSLVTF